MNVRSGAQILRITHAAAGFVAVYASCPDTCPSVNFNDTAIADVHNPPVCS